jgi:DNA-binding GntR family transcriptional regulator
MIADEPEIRDGQSVARVYERLRSAILNGESAPGQVSSQRELADGLGVSRTPLREALRMLQHEGLVELRPNRRFRTAPLSLADAEELYVVRVLLESVAIRMTVPRLTAEDVAHLEGLLAEMVYLAGSGSAGFTAAHNAFHGHLCRAAGGRVNETMAQLSGHAERYRVVYGTTPGHWPRRKAEHRAILDAAKVGDTEQAATELVAHYVTTVRLVAEGTEPEHPLERLKATVALCAPGALAAFA